MQRAIIGAALCVAAASCSESVSAPSSFVATSIRIVSGDGQSGRVATQLPYQLVVEVRDQHGQLMPGAIIAFDATFGSVGSIIGITDSTGIASTYYTLGTVATDYAITATASGMSTGVSFSAHGTAGAANHLADFGGNGQVADRGSTLQQPLVIAVVDVFGNPIAGVPVKWSSPSGGTFNTTQTVTASNGEAQVVYTLPPSAGTVSVVAHVDGLMDFTFGVVSR